MLLYPPLLLRSRIVADWPVPSTHSTRLGDAHHQLEVGGALPPWAQAQTTYAKLKQDEHGAWKVSRWAHGLQKLAFCSHKPWSNPGSIWLNYAQHFSKALSSPGPTELICHMHRPCCGAQVGLLPMCSHWSNTGQTSLVKHWSNPSNNLNIKPQESIYLTQFQVVVLKQKIWVAGVSYELQEIYGMEGNTGNSGQLGQGGDGDYDELEGRECVICMTNGRDTTVLPCRHMCMCQECASALKTQTNKCPICRCEGGREGVWCHCWGQRCVREAGFLLPWAGRVHVVQLCAVLFKGIVLPGQLSGSHSPCRGLPCLQ